MSSIAEKKLSKRLKILDAAYNLFSDAGINSTAIDDVVNLAGVAKGTFYLYFKDKYDLLDQITIYKSMAMLSAVAEKLEIKSKEKKIPLCERITLIMDEIILDINANIKLVAIMSRNTTGLITAAENTDNPKVYAMIEGIIEDCTALNLTHEEARSKIWTVIDMSLSAYFDTILNKLPCEPQQTIAVIHSLIANTFSGGESFD